MYVLQKGEHEMAATGDAAIVLSSTEYSLMLPQTKVCSNEVFGIICTTTCEISTETCLMYAFQKGKHRQLAETEPLVAPLTAKSYTALKCTMMKSLYICAASKSFVQVATTRNRYVDL